MKVWNDAKLFSDKHCISIPNLKHSMDIVDGTQKRTRKRKLFPNMVGHSPDGMSQTEA